MGFGRGFGGAPSRTDSGKKTINKVVTPAIEENNISLSIDDLKEGVIFINESGGNMIGVNLGLPTDSGDLVNGLGLSAGETFTFQIINFGDSPFKLDASSATKGYVFCGTNVASSSGIIKVEFICIEKNIGDVSRVVGLFELFDRQRR